MLFQQMLMMAWEAVLENWFMAILLITILVFSWATKRRTHRARINHKVSLMLALTAAILAFFGLPYVFSAELVDLTYWVDWVFHIAMVLGVFVYVYLVVMPFTGCPTNVCQNKT